MHPSSACLYADFLWRSISGEIATVFVLAAQAVNSIFQSTLCHSAALLQQHSKLRAHCCVDWDADAGPVHGQVLDIEVGVQLLVPIKHHHSPRAALQGSSIYLHHEEVLSSICDGCPMVSLLAHKMTDRCPSSVVYISKMGDKLRESTLLKARVAHGGHKESISPPEDPASRQGHRQLPKDPD